MTKKIKNVFQVHFYECLDFDFYINKTEFIKDDSEPTNNTRRGSQREKTQKLIN